MPQRKKRPTELPATVRNRSKIRTAARPVPTGHRAEATQQTGSQEPEETRAVLVSDPSQTAPQSPTRPQRPDPGPLVHQPEPQPESEDFVQNLSEPEPQPEPYSWYESALSLASEPTQPTQRGKVAFSVSDKGFEVCSQGADVHIQYENPSQLPQPEPLPRQLSLPLDPQPQSLDIAPQLAWCVGGFLAALLLCWIAVVSSPSDNTIIITPGPEVIRP